MGTNDRIKSLRVARNISQEELALALGYKSRATISRIENGSLSFPAKKLAECAEILDTTVDYLINGSTQLNLSVSDQSHVFKIPIYESVSAGFGAYAHDSIIGYEDVYVDNPADVPDLMFIKVHGDSMEPKIEDGDLIQVRRQTSIDSGDFGVVLVDNMDGFVKKVIYGPTWIELRSLNPKYAPMKFKNAEVTRIRVIGKVLKVTKTL